MHNGVTLKGIEKEKSNIIVKEKSVWTEEGVKYYHGNCEGWMCAHKKKWTNMEENKGKDKEVDNESKEKNNSMEIREKGIA